MGGWFAGVGIGHAQVEDLGRHQRCGDRLRFRSTIRLDLNSLAGEPRVMDGEDGGESLAQAAQGEAALEIGHHRPGPGRKVMDCYPEERDSINAATDPSRSPREITTERCDRECDVRGGLSLQVEESPLDHLLRWEGDLDVGLVVVGIEPDPAGTIARRQGDGAEQLVER